MLRDHVLDVPVVAGTEGASKSVKHLREKQLVTRPTGADWDIDLQVSYDEGVTWVDFAAGVTAAGETLLADGNGWPLVCTHVRVVTNAGGVPADPVTNPCTVTLYGWMVAR